MSHTVISLLVSLALVGACTGATALLFHFETAKWLNVQRVVLLASGVACFVYGNPSVFGGLLLVTYSVYDRKEKARAKARRAARAQAYAAMD